MRIAFALVFLALAIKACPVGADDLERWFEKQAIVGAVGAEVTPAGTRYHHFGVNRVGGDLRPGAETAFEIGSITKVFTHLLLAELVAKGRVEFTTTLGDLWPELEPANPEVAGITLLELATHRSGLPRMPPGFSPANPADPYADYDAAMLAESLERVRAGQTLVHAYAYSNFGVGLLGHLLGRVDGDGYGPALRRHVLAPLGLDRAFLNCAEGDSASGHHQGEPVPHWNFDALAGAGALCASAADLVRLMTVQLEGESPLIHDLEADLRIIAEVQPGLAITPVWHVAWAGDAPIYWHNGGTGGFKSFVGFRPDQGRAWVLLTNSRQEVTARGLALLGASPLGDGNSGVSAGDEDLEAYTGYFALSPSFGLSVTRHGAKLQVQGTGQARLSLGAAGEDRFSVLEVDAQLEFHRDDRGRVIALTLHQNGLAQRAERVPVDDGDG